MSEVEIEGEAEEKVRYEAAKRERQERMARKLIESFEAKHKEIAE